MKTKRIFFAMIGLVCILSLLVVGSVVYGNSIFEKQAAELIKLKLEDQLIKEQQTALIQANKDIDKYAELEKVANTIVPQDKDQAKAVREITNIAEANGITISSITFPTSELGSKPAAAAEDSTEGASEETPTTSETQVKPVSGISGVYSLEITVKPAGTISFAQLVDFLEDLERNRRTAQITDIDIRPTANSSQLSFDITLNVYIRP